MDMRNNKPRNVLTHARVSFSQSEMRSLLCVLCVCVCVWVRGGGVKVLVSTGGGGGGELTEKIRNLSHLNHLERFYSTKTTVILKWVNIDSSDYDIEDCDE